MREPTALIKEFNTQEELMLEGVEHVAEAFRLPVRNWNALIDSYNEANKKKFPFSSLQCRIIIEYTKRGHPPKHILEYMGWSVQRYTSILTRVNELEDRLLELAAKDKLQEKEMDELHMIMRNPYRLLMEDIGRAEGLCKLEDWERFNEMANKANDLQAMKMKAKYKDHFAEKSSESPTGTNIVINLGGDFINEI